MFHTFRSQPGPVLKIVVQRPMWHENPVVRLVLIIRYYLPVAGSDSFLGIANMWVAYHALGILRNTGVFCRGSTLTFPVGTGARYPKHGALDTYYTAG